MVYGYSRVSTQMQAKDGNSLAAQEQLLKENGKDTFRRFHRDQGAQEGFSICQKKHQPFLTDAL